MSRARLNDAIAVSVVACFALALTSFGLAEAYWFQGAMSGMAGAYAREINPARAPWIEAEAQRMGLSALESTRVLVRGGFGLAVLAVIGSIVAALRTYRDWRRWHWLTFAAAVPVIGAAWF